MKEVQLGSEMPTRFQTGDRIKHDPIGAGTVISSDARTVTVRLDAGDRETRFVADESRLTRIEPWSEGRISPSWGELRNPERLIPTLTRGERDLAAFLDAYLEPDWRIYVRPHLDADHPVIAAIHPRWGGMIWDVCPWDITAARLEGDYWHVRVDGVDGRFLSPMKHLNAVRAKLYGTYLPKVGESINDADARFSLLGAGLYFPLASTRDVRRLVAPISHVALAAFGRDTIEAGDIDRARTVRGGERMAPDWFADFDSVLSHAHRQGDPLAAPPLPKALVRLTEPRTESGVLHGVAGSAKTTVLAYRAVRHAANRQRVLVVTFNRTLANYIRWMAGHVPIRHRPEYLTVTHLHGLLGLIFSHHGQRRPTTDSEHSEDQGTSRRLEVDWPLGAARLLADRGVPPQLRFDVVLVDEAQDFPPAYADVLDRLRAPGGAPIVLAHDPAQAIYGREAAVGDSNHLWSTLKATKLVGGFRLSGPAAAAASDFAAHWELPTAPIEVLDAGLFGDDQSPVLHAARSPGDAAAVALSVVSGWQAEPGYRAGQTAILVPSKTFGSALVRLLAEEGSSTNHVFPVRATGGMLETAGAYEVPWLLSSSNKDSFVVGDARLKVSTVHSFKGWDAANVIFLLPSLRSRPTARQLAEVYVGITRSTGRTVIVGDASAFGLHKLGLPTRVTTPDPEIAGRFDALLAVAEASHPALVRRPTTVLDVEEWE